MVHATAMRSICLLTALAACGQSLRAEKSDSQPSLLDVEVLLTYLRYVVGLSPGSFGS